MKTEVEYLKHIKSQIASANYGEGINFNIDTINSDIDNRIKQIESITNEGSKNLNELLEALKDFDVWKEWKYTNQIPN